MWVRDWSGGGPMWIAQSSDIERLTTLTIWLWVRLSARCMEALGWCSPGESPMWILHTIGIEALVGLTLAAGEAHITFSLIP